MNVLERLTTELHYPLLCQEADLQNLTQANLHSVIFLPAEPKHFPETLDVAVVLPELLKVFNEALQPAVADLVFAKTLAARYAISEWPTLLFLRNSDYLGHISRMRDWQVYLQKITTFLHSPLPPKTLGIGVAVVSTPKEL